MEFIGRNFNGIIAVSCIVVSCIVAYTRLEGKVKSNKVQLEDKIEANKIQLEDKVEANKIQLEDKVEATEKIFNLYKDQSEKNANRTDETLREIRLFIGELKSMVDKHEGGLRITVNKEGSE